MTEHFLQKLLATIDVLATRPGGRKYLAAAYAVEAGRLPPATLVGAGRDLSSTMYK